MVVFDGVEFAKRLENKLRIEKGLVGKKLVIFQTGVVESTYVRLKREMGIRLGVEVRVMICKSDGDLKMILKQVQDDGVVVQLPIAGVNETERDEILRMIPPEKDVDGLNPDGRNFLPAAVLAVAGAVVEVGVRRLRGV